MTEQIVSLSAVSIALVPIVLAVTQIIKSFLIDTRFVPVISIVLGIVFSLAVPSSTLFYTIIQGVLVGLSASGLFSATKTTFSPN